MNVQGNPCWYANPNLGKASTIVFRARSERPCQRVFADRYQCQIDVERLSYIDLGRTSCCSSPIKQRHTGHRRLLTTTAGDQRLYCCSIDSVSAPTAILASRASPKVVSGYPHGMLGVVTGVAGAQGVP
jgi:hypothetical protein